MSHRAPGEHMSYAEYVAREVMADVKHEFVRGEVFAMAGGTIEHAALSTAVAVELSAALRGRRCAVYGSDLRIRVRATDLATELCTYPDVSVVCQQAESLPDDPHAIVNPTVIVEVLSDSTEAYDRGAKASHYRRLASLREYVLVNQHERRIEVFHRNERGLWELSEAGPGERITLPSLDVSLAVDAVYADPLS